MKKQMPKFIVSGDETPEQIKHILETNADKIEPGDYFRKATPAELQDAAEMVSELSIKISVLADHKKTFMTNHKAKVSPLQDELKHKVELKKNKGEMVKNENLYKFIDHELGLVGLYAESGELISQRPIMENERENQTNIIGQIRTAGNE